MARTYCPLLLLLVWTLAGCISPDPDPASLPVYRSNWAVYSNQLEGSPAVIAVDLGLDSLAPLSSHPLLVRISLPARRTDENGFPVESEMRQMVRLEQELETAARNRGAILAGRTTGSGHRNLFFYVPYELSLEKTAKKVLATDQFPYAEKVDEKWSFFRQTLCPDRYEMHQVRNDMVINQLEEAGDDLSAPRPIDHWLYFPDAESRRQAIAAFEKEGFSVAGARKLEQPDPNPYELHLLRVDRVNRGYFYDLTLWMERQAEEKGGMYDGWETMLARHYQAQENSE